MRTGDIKTPTTGIFIAAPIILVLNVVNPALFIFKSQAIFESKQSIIRQPIPAPIEPEVTLVVKDPEGLNTRFLYK